MELLSGLGVLGFAWNSGTDSSGFAEVTKREREREGGVGVGNRVKGECKLQVFIYDVLGSSISVIQVALN